jgi:hypothetical protein
MEEEETEVKDNYHAGIYRHPAGMVFRIVRRTGDAYEICVLQHPDNPRNLNKNYHRRVITEAERMTAQEITAFFHFPTFEEYKIEYPDVTRVQYEALRLMHVNDKADKTLNMAVVDVHY